MKRALLALALLPGSTAAFAQMETGMQPTNLPGGELYLPGTAQDAENLNAQQVREGMLKFGKCIARRRPKEASEFVMQNSLQAWNALRPKIDDDCVLEAVANPGEEVSVSSNSRDVLFALAEALMQKNLDSLNLAAIATAAPLAPTDPLEAVGECSVRANPAAARNLLKTKPNSKEEMLATQSVLPAFSGCLPTGMKVKFDVVAVRGTVARSLYRLSSAPQAPATPTKVPGR